MPGTADRTNLAHLGLAVANLLIIVLLAIGTWGNERTEQHWRRCGPALPTPLPAGVTAARFDRVAVIRFETSIHLMH